MAFCVGTFSGEKSVNTEAFPPYLVTKSSIVVIRKKAFSPNFLVLY